jgi:hypothetical protein
VLGPTTQVIIDEEPIEGLSFPVYRRIATMMLVPAQSSLSSVEMLTIDPTELAMALGSDVAATAAIGEQSSIEMISS